MFQQVTIGRSGLLGLWCLMDPRMAGGIASVECSFLYVFPSSFCSFFNLSSCAFNSRSILLNGGLDTSS